MHSIRQLRGLDQEIKAPSWNIIKLMWWNYEERRIALLLNGNIRCAITIKPNKNNAE